MVDVASPSAEVMAAAMGQPLQDAQHPVDAIRELVPTHARLQVPMHATCGSLPLS